MRGRTAAFLGLVSGLGLAAILLSSPRVVPELADRVGLPPEVALGGAVAVTAAYACALAARTGGRPVVTGALALALASAAVLSEEPVLLAGAAVSMSVLTGSLAVMATRPTRSFPSVVRECLIGTALAAIGACVVAAYGAEVSYERVRYLAFGLSLVVALGLVYRLSDGAHRLGRRGSAMLVSGVLVLLVGLAYAEALTRWGPPGLVATITDGVAELRARWGAVPMPVAAFVGLPALAWGVFSRARASQGWWICVFAAPAMSVVAVSLLHPTRSLEESGLALLYSILVGMVLGYLAIGIDVLVTGGRGRGARVQETRSSPAREEPHRSRALM